MGQTKLKNEFVKAKTYELKMEYNKERNITDNKKLWGMV